MGSSKTRTASSSPTLISLSRSRTSTTAASRPRSAISTTASSAVGTTATIPPRPRLFAGLFSAGPWCCSASAPRCRWTRRPRLAGARSSFVGRDPSAGASAARAGTGPPGISGQATRGGAQPRRRGPAADGPSVDFGLVVYEAEGKINWADAPAHPVGAAGPSSRYWVAQALGDMLVAAGRSRPGTRWAGEITVRGQHRRRRSGRRGRSVRQSPDWLNELTVEFNLLSDWRDLERLIDGSWRMGATQMGAATRAGRRATRFRPAIRQGARDRRRQRPQPQDHQPCSPSCSTWPRLAAEMADQLVHYIEGYRTSTS